MHNRIGINSQVKSLWRNVHGLALKHGVGAHIHKLERYIWMNHYWHDQLKAMELVGVLGSGMRLGSMLNRDS